MLREPTPPQKTIKVTFAGILLLLFVGSIILPSTPEQAVSAMNPLDLEETSTPTSTSTFTPIPTFTPTPLTGLSLVSWSSGCTTGPYITCSASVTDTHTDPYRWDFDITYNYNDNRTNFGSTFSLKLRFATGVFYTGVPIYWDMYPIENEVMPSRRINVLYAVASDLNSMEYPSGMWTIPAQPIPYDKFEIIFSRTTSNPEILVRTDKWHLTLSTYPNVGTPTPMPTATYTPTFTPTSTFTSTPTITLTPTITFTPSNTPTLMTYTPIPGTPQNNGSGPCWISKASWATYTVAYDIDTSPIPGNISEVEWGTAIEASAQTWNDVTPSQFTLIKQSGSPNIVSYQEPSNPIYLAVSAGSPSSGFMAGTYIRINPDYLWDVNNTPAQGTPGNNGSTITFNLQNVVTHEFGHWVFLDDIYDPNCTQVTMDHDVAHGELIKIDLDSADIEGINWQYP